MNRKIAERGSTMVEFAFICIPLLFAVVSVFEMGRGMWNYHTLQYAVKATGRYVAVHGSTCGIPPNSCTIRVADIMAVFRVLANGVPITKVKLTLTSFSGTTVTCDPVSNCANNSILWPPYSPGSDPDNSPGKTFAIRADYRFTSSLSMVAPGGGRIQFGIFNLVAYTRPRIIF